MQHCDSSNVSDISEQKVKLTRCILVRKKNKSYYSLVKLIVTYLKVVLIMPKLLLVVAILSLDMVECIGASVEALSIAAAIEIHVQCPKCSTDYLNAIAGTSV